ncbi:hypothetical protein XAP412_1260006 [Xanthomonas phaseoli pv. phaseoli]|uniref:Uncharacterized protein n=1 Tax=Xanthomonas campestris pv. phaseoli TaxID=317013 RepID=A0AB38DVT4_XANCH|nr:hypothetical protein XAP6984_1280028 [Xanthomonas phaseoli pv. phaseoli]SON78967.1 hypothetical protein XAP412_1260006 [Xanthomonas phaseoli pv. phaseoli]SON82291.1 hypothetical protein XAP7430_1270006 [Xanthomonas phaseoli pv. phaseoli]SOO31372.1 hypothetical protein XAP6164_5410009 [Xanthomonas phaseoli pv. phaseoli]
MPGHRPMPASHRARQHASLQRPRHHLAVLRATPHRPQIWAIGRSSDRKDSVTHDSRLRTTVVFIPETQLYQTSELTQSIAGSADNAALAASKVSAMRLSSLSAQPQSNLQSRAIS